MALRDKLRAIFMREDDAEAPMPGFFVQFDSDGANFLMERDALAQLERGEGQRTAQEQFIVLGILEETGAASRLPNGFEVGSADVAELGDDEAEILGLPPRFPGEFVANINGNTHSRNFGVSILAKVGVHAEPWERVGAQLRVGTSRIYRLGLPALRALEAAEKHHALPFDQRSETQNVTLVAQLQDAIRMSRNEDLEAVGVPSFDVDLAHLSKFETVVPGSVGLTLEQEADGSLALTPDLGTGDDPGKLNSRWHQLDLTGGGGVLRVDDKLVLIDEQTMAGVKEVLAKRRIPASQVQDFLKAPGDFIDCAAVDVELDFSVRVKGIGALVPVSFNDATTSGIGWFDDVDAVLEPGAFADLASTLEELESVREHVEKAWAADQDLVAVDEHVVDVSDRERVKGVISKIRQKLEQAERPVTEPAPQGDVRVGVIVEDAESTTDGLRRRANEAKPPRPVDYASLNRSPFEHQRDGIEWMAGLMAASLVEDLNSVTRVQGAILADDMGLGKTFMMIVALREFMEAQRRRGEEPRPMLAVLPLSLIENWEDEIRVAFPESPFVDVVVLQGERDLSRYRVQGGRRETVAASSALDEEGMLRQDAIRLSLAVGEGYGERRLDMPGRLVLTTYETLSSFQLSLGQVEWGAVVFDEAQATKNPDALRTRAAKGLKARFKLMATGTPVENKLMDLWCLADTAQPGLLGTWPEFREEWVSSVDTEDSLAKEASGLRLRERIGPFMLRRVKEDHLPNLPSKTIYTGLPSDNETYRFDPTLAVEMPDAQRTAYDAQLAQFPLRARKSSGAALETIQMLKAVSLHPHAIGDGMLAAGVALGMGARLVATVRILDGVRDLREKAIVFVSNKKVQAKLSLWLRDRYGLPVAVVNGDTKAVSKGASATRRSIIQDFERRDGFNVIIMSPLAVGTGLTVVGANHAIHLERHWNPAKEAQATDRIYRIGQTRPVHVYLPLALHPTLESFDVNLDRLLRQKTALKDAVVVPEVVKESEIAAAMGLVG